MSQTTVIDYSQFKKTKKVHTEHKCQAHLIWLLQFIEWMTRLSIQGHIEFLIPIAINHSDFHVISSVVTGEHSGQTELFS